MGRPRIPNPRSVLIALRVTPRTRYGLQLLAQRAQCSISEVILQAVEAKFRSSEDGLVCVANGERTPTSVLDRTWSPTDYERLVRTGLLFPDLLSETERYLWLVIRETRAYWKSTSSSKRLTARDVNWKALAADWAALNATTEPSTQRRSSE